MTKLSKFKIALVGDQNVGKTSIISRFVHDSFEQIYKPTIGIDFVSKTMQVQGRTLRLQLWDTAGQQRFQSLIPSYVKDADCCLIVFDLSQKSSFDNLHKWIDFVRESKGHDGRIFLIGNKSDLEGNVSKEEIEQFSEKNNIPYQQISAKNGTNIILTFRKVAESLVEDKTTSKTQSEAKKTEVQDAPKIVLKKPEQKKNDGSKCNC